jgi:hypothetical protein
MMLISNDQLKIDGSLPPFVSTEIKIDAAVLEADRAQRTEQTGRTQVGDKLIISILCSHTHLTPALVERWAGLA